MSEFSGVITALASPFKNGQFFEPDFERLLENQIDQGVNGFVINGTTGESPNLHCDEVKRQFEMAKSASHGKNKKLIIGAGLNSTRNTCELIEKMNPLKPDALLIVVPYYNRPTQEGLFQHFSAAAKAAKVPIILYNVPSRTVARLEPETVTRLAQVVNIAGIKDATGDMDQLEKIKSGVNSSFALLSGDDATCVEYCARGGHGVIAVASHVIGEEMIEAIKQRATADYQKRFANLFKALYVEANPIPVKMALNMMNIFSSPELRLPLTTLSVSYHEELKRCLAQLGKI